LPAKPAARSRLPPRCYEPGCGVGDRRNRPAVDPTAFQGRDITWQGGAGGTHGNSNRYPPSTRQSMISWPVSSRVLVEKNVAASTLMWNPWTEKRPR
jgi:hypothetical protein